MTIQTAKNRFKNKKDAQLFERLCQFEVSLVKEMILIKWGVFLGMFFLGGDF